MTVTVTAAPAGFAALLDRAHETAAPGGPVASSAGYVLASHAALPGAPPGPLTRLGIAVERSEPSPIGPVVYRFAADLLAAQCAVLEAALRLTLRRLDARTSGGTTLLSRQLVQGQVAEIALTLSQEHGTDWVAAGPSARWRGHLRLVAAGRQLLRLHGASGFVLARPGTELYLAQVAGNVYLHPGEDGPR